MQKPVDVTVVAQTGLHALSIDEKLNKNQFQLH
jgi:hypothetical protein